MGTKVFSRDWRYFSIVGLGLFFVSAGIRYSPAYMTDIFTSAGELPERFSRMVTVFDIVSILLGVFIILISGYLRRHWGNLVTAAVSTLLTLVALEAGFRIYFQDFAIDQQARYLPEKSIKIKPVYSRHHYLGYYPTPDYVSPDGLNYHNSTGYRGEEFSLKKPDGEYRIVLIGGSSTYTEEVRDFKKSYSYRLEEMLRNDYGHPNVRVINAGVGGWDSFQSLINLEFRILELQPDLIVINHNINDVHVRMVNPRFYQSDNSGRRRPWQALKEPVFMQSVLVRFVLTKLTGVSFEPALSRYCISPRSVTGVISGDFNPVLGDTPMNTLKNNPPVYFRRNLEDMVVLSLYRGSDVLLMTWPYSRAFDDYMNTPHYVSAVEEQNQVIRDVAAEFKNKNVYLYELKADMPEAREDWADGRHVNEAGSSVKAGLVARYLHDHILPGKEP